MASEASFDERFSEIMDAAEAAAEGIRADAEQKMRDRIAEGNRAADNRVRAAESEAAELMTDAREDAARLREGASSDAKAMITQATSDARDIIARAQSEADRIKMDVDGARSRAESEALVIVARAQENAEIMLTEAAAEAEKIKNEAQDRSRQLLKQAREAAAAVSVDGRDIVNDLQEMGDAMRSNAARLLRDVQVIHSAMLDQIDRVDPSRRAEAASAPITGPVRPLSGGSRGGSAAPRGSDARRSSRGPDDGLDVPEFLPRG
jgi:cell division septum initiation protein DivIVA